MIPKNEYVRITELMPILCVDVVVRNERGEYLLVKRANPPMQDEWWVVGGRVLKGETLGDAVARKVKEEAGLEVSAVQPLGYFETIADANPFGLPFDYHAVSVVFRTDVGDDSPVRLDAQSVEWKWAPELPARFHIRSLEEAS